MGIVSNSLQTQRGIAYGTGFLGSGGGRTYFGPFAIPWQINANSSMLRANSFPSGYGIRGYFEALKAGGIGCKSFGSASVEIVSRGDANISASSSGVSVVVINGVKGYLFGVTVNGFAYSSVVAAGMARIACDIQIGAIPSAQDIADAVWQRAASAFTAPGTMAQEVKQARSSADQSLKTGQFIALKDS